MCGIFAFVGNRPDTDTLRSVAQLAGPRGPHTWGQAWIERGLLSCRRYDGGVDPARIAPARILIGHARLATSGDISLTNAQPITSCDVAIAHNGNVYNHRDIFDLYGYSPKTANDSEAILTILLHGLPDQVLELVDPRSPLALLAIVHGKLIAVRHGHPLWMAQMPEGTYFFSRQFPGSAEFADNHFEVIND